MRALQPTPLGTTLHRVLSVVRKTNRDEEFTSDRHTRRYEIATEMNGSVSRDQTGLIYAERHQLVALALGDRSTPRHGRGSIACLA